MITSEQIKNNLKNYLPFLNNEALEKLEAYYFLIEEENQKYNLTGFKDEKLLNEGIIESILTFKFINENILNLSEKEVLDIGAGAGFPTVPYLLINPTFNLTIYEALNKRVNFLNLVKEKLNLKNLEIKHIRCEESKEINKFDFITARAVAELHVLMEISHHVAKIGATFCFLKSKNFLDEVLNSNFITKKLRANFTFFNLEKYFEKENILVTYTKESETPQGIPRKWNQIK
ncbi:16S rRNA (guanine527-N7)-methyltransferase [Metamycoplasma subdolum]|uniref:Ribosomal RNA small subunit methyltransferase G n=1 Tax=Metamycoplasma subdolum TaxID=92407 RepID=A0A3M0A259_9BACT|nr:16S rRNA (guanine(527)-N(7))-methyltransferase RsmG [Metamycoplasma subdolum]RMA79073.1 16S rRNA (guanine527-N7)-methyltransferase [Metamycoplasma subdolum]WPB50596.1 16S rRNA (guanine(527)-N(7))-methyltransferase RsmG [Metamycoplasma subdolum]